MAECHDKPINAPNTQECDNSPLHEQVACLLTTPSVPDNVKQATERASKPPVVDASCRTTEENDHTLPAISIDHSMASEREHQPTQADVDNTRSILKHMAKPPVMDQTEFDLFQKNLDKFGSRKQLSLTEQKDTLEATKALLDSKTSVSADGQAGIRNNILAAEGVIYHAADPDTVSQGESGTCGSSSIETNLFKTHPSIAAQMVKSAMLEGKWRGVDGKQKPVEIDPSTLIPNDKGESASTFPPGKHEDGRPMRTYATQVLGASIFNDIGQHLAANLKFVEDETLPAGTYYGMEWKDPSKSISNSGFVSMADDSDKGVSSGVVDPVGGLTAWQVSEEWTRLTGETKSVFQSGSYKYDGTGPNKIDSGKDHGYVEASIGRGAPDPVKDQDLNYVDPMAGTEQFLKQLKSASAKGPIIIQLASGLLRPLEDGREAGKLDSIIEPDHFVSAFNLHTKDGKSVIDIHDSDYAETFHDIRVDDLYKALGKPEP